MPRLLYIVLILILTYAKASAQQDSVFTDTVSSTSSSKLDSVKRSIFQNKRTDTLKAKVNRSKEALAKKKATIKAKLDKLHPNSAIDKANHKLDSLNPSNRLEVAAPSQKLDSLIQNKKLEALNGKLDSTRASFTNRLDSLTQIPMPDSLLTKKILALQTGLDSLRNIKGVKEIAKAQEKLNQVQGKITSSVSNIEGKVNSKFSGFKENGGGGGSLNFSGAVSKVGLTSKLPSSGFQPPASLNNFSLKPQPLKVPTLAKVQLPEANKKIGGFSLKTPVSPLTIPSTKNLNLDSNIPGAEKLTNATGELNKIGELGKQAKAYQEDIEKLTKGDSATMEKLQQGLETKLENMDAVKGITGNTNIEALKNLETNPEAMQEMIFNNAKEQAVNHFAGHEKELLAAVEQLTKSKLKFTDADSLADLMETPPDPIKSKSLFERLLLRLGLQVQSSTNMWFDFNPNLGYRVSNKLNVGFGWVERISVNFGRGGWISQDRIFGPRMYCEHFIKKNFYVRAEAEYINSRVTSPYIKVSTTDYERASNWNYLVGIRKSFRFSNRVNGDIQTLYNLYNPLQRSPYSSNFQIRAGFEIPWVKAN